MGPLYSGGWKYNTFWFDKLTSSSNLLLVLAPNVLGTTNSRRWVLSAKAAVLWLVVREEFDQSRAAILSPRDGDVSRGIRWLPGASTELPRRSQLLGAATSAPYLISKTPFNLQMSSLETAIEKTIQTNQLTRASSKVMPFPVLWHLRQPFCF